MTTPYTYTVLRYVHDVVTGECVNLGILLHAPGARFLDVRCVSTLGRVSRTFARADVKALKGKVRALEGALRKMSRDWKRTSESLFPSRSAEELARSILPLDDSSLQFSGHGAGLTEFPQQTLDLLYERFVTRYSHRAGAETRDDQEVLSAFKRRLRERNVLEHLAPGVIETPDYRHEFPLSFRNGQLNACEAVSFDLLEANAILDKANRWLGRGVTLNKSLEPFQLVLLIGEPSSPSLGESAERALRIMEQMPCPHRFYRESQAQEFVDEVAMALNH